MRIYYWWYYDITILLKSLIFFPIIFMLIIILIVGKVIYKVHLCQYIFILTSNWCTARIVEFFWKIIFILPCLYIKKADYSLLGNQVCEIFYGY
jgi:hypothetical protein